MASVHEAVADLHGIGLVDKATMRRFDELCLTAVPEYSPDEIKALRERLNISQAVLASVINAGVNSIQKWERGAKKPSGTALKLLNLLDRKGLESVM
ncbi:MAG: DNA-binding transcriptional regulator [Deltaproteobacteria bacterium]|jgi:putative transcriptional regulator|nr:DNA-binding transcriptional regulator [Deltaproteobacteria bacterium]